MRFVTSLALWAFSLAAPLGAHGEALSAAQARAAVSGGALVWDVRAATAPSVIAGAVRLPAAAAQGWLDRGDLAVFERAVSAAGLDLSRDLVLYGVAGDPLAQALHERLSTIAKGRVDWLVGGIDEWHAAGLPVASSAADRLPVPQHLVVRNAAAPSIDAPAAPSLRLGRETTVQRLAALANANPR